MKYRNNATRLSCMLPTKCGWNKKISIHMIERESPIART